MEITNDRVVKRQKAKNKKEIAATQAKLRKAEAVMYDFVKKGNIKAYLEARQTVYILQRKLQAMRNPSTAVTAGETIPESKLTSKF